MMEVLAGNPTFLVLCGALTTVLLVFMYCQNYDKRLRPFLAISIAMTILPLLIDFAVTTDKESLRKHVLQMARCVRQNDLDSLLQFVDPAADSVVSQMNREFPTMDFKMCTVSGFRSVNVDPDDRDKAVVKFKVVVIVNAPTYGVDGGPYTREVTLKLRRELSKKWLVTGYSHSAHIARPDPARD